MYQAMKHTLLTCIVFSFVLSASTVYSFDVGPTCPDVIFKFKERLGGCASIQCETGLTQEKCQKAGGVLEQDVAMCGCCPGCVKTVHKYLDQCDPNDNLGEPNYDPNCIDHVCPIVRYCPQGLECDPTPTPTCNVTLTFNPAPPLPGQDCPDKCFIKKAIIEKENELYAPRRRAIPTCTPDGYFAPKQCKGNKNKGDCFCVDKCGERLFGRQLFDRAENMTCGCTMLVHNLRQNNRLATLHCQENGDFEPLQCDLDSGLCYCVDEITGKTTGEVLPESKFKLLPCYSVSNEDFSNDGRYLRVCDSEWAAGLKISHEALLHGLAFSHRPMECDYDGGFAPKYRDTSSGQEHCVHRSGSPLGYFRRYTAKTKMDCKCARDKVYYPRYGIPFLPECYATDSGNPEDPAPGSYKMFEVNDQVAYCLDSDGFEFGPDVPSSLVCCLDDTCENSTLCTVNNNIYHPCSKYIMGRD